MQAPNLFGKDLFGEPVQPKASGPVAQRFIVPPFSVLDAKAGEWQERKRAWLAMGIQSELGRGGAHTYNIGDKADWERSKMALHDSKEFPSLLARKAMYDAGGRVPLLDGGKARKPENQERMSQEYGIPLDKMMDGSSAGIYTSGTSVFDPVLCELAYRWWCPPKGQVLDPFAGGSVRGVVAGALGLKYWGCDLRREQVEANQQQAAMMSLVGQVEWHCLDALDLESCAPRADFLFTCPPYGDLEVYSEDPRDLSNMEHHTFVANYKRIIMRACKMLKPNRFACFVVGDFRDGMEVIMRRIWHQLFGHGTENVIYPGPMIIRNIEPFEAEASNTAVIKCKCGNQRIFDYGY